MTGTQRSLHSNDGETCAATLERTVLLPCAGQQIASETLPDLVRPGGTCGDPADCDGRTLRSCMPITELLSVLPILYGNRESGHSYKVKLAMTLLGYPHEYRAVDLDLPLERRPADFRAVSLFGEVPVLVEGARRIVHSRQRRDGGGRGVLQLPFLDRSGRPHARELAACASLARAHSCVAGVGSTIRLAGMRRRYPQSGSRPVPTSARFARPRLPEVLRRLRPAGFSIPRAGRGKSVTAATVIVMSAPVSESAAASAGA